MKIASLDVGDGVFAAPLAGISDAAQRQLCLEFGADLTVTEMVSAKGLAKRGEDTEKLLLLPPSTKPVGVQLFGADVFAMKEAAENPLLDKFDFIDINMGCPVPKVTRTGAGSALMKTVDRAATLVRVVKEAGKRPVTVKFRLGYEENDKNYLDFGKAMQAAGADAVTLHVRTRAQGYSGFADHTATAKLRAALTIPVIANGDIVDKQSYDAVRAQTGCEMVMIGRGAMGRPWIFSEIKERAVEIDIRAFVCRHYELLTSYYDERYAIVMMRHLLGHYLRGMTGASKARCALNTATEIQDVFAVLDDLFMHKYD